MEDIAPPVRISSCGASAVQLLSAAAHGEVCSAQRHLTPLISVPQDSWSASRIS